jgi:hypothetical protein
MPECAFAARFFPSRNPIGTHVQPGIAPGELRQRSVNGQLLAAGAVLFIAFVRSGFESYDFIVANLGAGSRARHRVTMGNAKLHIGANCVSLAEQGREREPQPYSVPGGAADYGMRRARPARHRKPDSGSASSASEDSNYLVTGNLRDFPKFWKQTTVVSPREFIGIVAPHLTAG